MSHQTNVNVLPCSVPSWVQSPGPLQVRIDGPVPSLKNIQKCFQVQQIICCCRYLWVLCGRCLYLEGISETGVQTHENNSTVNQSHRFLCGVKVRLTLCSELSKQSVRNTCQIQWGLNEELELVVVQSYLGLNLGACRGTHVRSGHRGFSECTEETRSEFQSSGVSCPVWLRLGASCILSSTNARFANINSNIRSIHFHHGIDTIADSPCVHRSHALLVRVNHFTHHRSVWRQKELSCRTLLNLKNDECDKSRTFMPSFWLSGCSFVFTSVLSFCNQYCFVSSSHTWSIIWPLCHTWSIIWPLCTDTPNESNCSRHGAHVLTWFNEFANKKKWRWAQNLWTFPAGI